MWLKLRSLLLRLLQHGNKTRHSEGIWGILDMKVDHNSSKSMGKVNSGQENQVCVLSLRGKATGMRVYLWEQPDRI